MIDTNKARTAIKFLSLELPEVVWAHANNILSPLCDELDASREKVAKLKSILKPNAITWIRELEEKVAECGAVNAELKQRIEQSNAYLYETVQALNPNMETELIQRIKVYLAALTPKAEAEETTDD